MDKKTKQTGPVDELTKSITTKYRTRLYSKFVKAIKEFKLINDGDKICCCISGGKDSMTMAKLFQIFHSYGDIDFEVKYLVMNPGYNEKNLDLIKHNLQKLNIDAVIEDTDIFEVANALEKDNPCFMCAKMRRGALYGLAKKWGCNKIALGHHYDDVIITTLMNLLNAGSFQTMLPKLVSENYGGMELIRPLYYIREKDIIMFSKAHDLHYIACACKFTESVANSDDPTMSQRAYTKELIKKLLKDIPQVEMNLFAATNNVNLNMILGYKSDETGKVSFLDDYEEKKAKRLENAKKAENNK